MKKLHPCAFLLSSILLFSSCVDNPPPPQPQSRKPSKPQVRTNAQKCNEFAAHPQDPGRSVKNGVEDDNIAARPAIQYCEAAVRENPKEPTYAFQLGRAYLAMRKIDDAARMFAKAAEMDYGPAFKYLGDHAFEQGNYEQAKEQYEYAAANGFTPATAALQELESHINSVTFRPELFSDTLMVQLYERKYAEIQESLKAYFYIKSMFDTLNSSQTLLLDPSCKPLVDALTHQYGIPVAGITTWVKKVWDTITSDRKVLKERGWEIAKNLALQSVIKEQAEKDTIVLVNNYTCQSPVTKTVYANAIGYLKEMLIPSQGGEQQKAENERKEK